MYQPIFIYEEVTQLPAVMQNIGLALLAIFIPLAISLFEQNDEADYRLLDRVVKQDHVLGAKTFLFKVALLFTPLLFWDLDSFLVRSLLFIGWLCGVGLVVDTLVRIYKWIRRGKMEHRLSYLKNLTIEKDIPELWRSVWEAAGKNSSADKDFFKIFTNFIDGNLNPGQPKEKVNLATELIKDSKPFFLKRPIFYLTSQDDAFSKFLKWHISAWKKENQLLVLHDASEEWMSWRMASSQLDEIFKTVIIESLKSGNSFGLFQLLDKHTKAFQGEFVKDGERNRCYTKSFFQVFCPVFFNHIYESNERYEIWEHYFPKLWLITKSTLENNEAISRAVLEEFFEWAQDRMRIAKEKEWDGPLENVAKELFPTTDPISWSIILTFISRLGNKDILKLLIEYPRNFGLMGRARTFWGSEEYQQGIIQQTNEELKSTAELAIKIFPGVFNKDNLNFWIKGLQELSYPQESREEYYKKEILEIFQTILAIAQ